MPHNEFPVSVLRFHFADDVGERQITLMSQCLFCRFPGKRNTQQIERKHLTLRTRIKRLARKTICFSKSIELHDIVIGLFVNRYEFGLSV
jgi:insertion element IS1 protein InsB